MRNHKSFWYVNLSAVIVILMLCAGCGGGGGSGGAVAAEEAAPVWESVSAGADHTLAVKTDGSLWAWGFNWSGQLGYETGDDDYSLVPIQVGSE